VARFYFCGMITAAISRNIFFFPRSSIGVVAFKGLTSLTHTKIFTLCEQIGRHKQYISNVSKFALLIHYIDFRYNYYRSMYVAPKIAAE
jgi:hypothetical protein